MKSFDDRPELPLGTTDQNPLTVSQLTGQLKGLVEEVLLWRIFGKTQSHRVLQPV